MAVTRWTTAGIELNLTPRIVPTAAGCGRHRIPELNLNALHLANFKAFASSQRVPLRPITLIYGANSAGKSSVLHALALAHHAIHTGDADVERTRLGGDAIDLGGFRQYVHLRDPHRIVQLGFELDLGAVAGRPFRGVRAVCKVDLGFARTKARYLQVAEFIRQRTRCSENDVFLEFKTGRLEQELDLARAQELKHWISIGTHADDPRREYHYLGNADTCPPVPSGHTVPPRRNSGYTPPEVEIDWDGGVRLQRFALDTGGAPLLCLSNSEEWQFDVAWDHPAIHEIVCQKLGENGLSLGIRQRADQPRVTASPLRLFPRLEPHEPVGPAPDDPLAPTLYGIVNDIGAALEAEFGRLIYLGPLRYWPARSDTFAPRSDPDWFAGAAAWDLTRTNPDVRRRVNEWLSAEHLLKTPYRLELRDLVSTEDLKRELPRRLHKAFHDLVVTLTEDDVILEEDVGEQPLPADPDDPYATADHVDSLLAEHGFNEQKFAQRWVSEMVAARRDVRQDLRLIDIRSGTTVSARDVGAGISQVLPILVSAFALKDHLLAIEQPEVHLHPALQAELGDVFLRSAFARGNTLLVETHSEHLLLRIMRRLRETAAGDLPNGAPAVRPEDVMVLFVEPDGPRSIIREMPLNERGELVKAWPGGFFEEGLQEMF